MGMTIFPVLTVVFGVGICNAKAMLTTENRGILSLVSIFSRQPCKMVTNLKSDI